MTAAVIGGGTIAIGFKSLQTMPIRLSLENFMAAKRDEQYVELFRKLRQEEPDSVRGLLVQAARHGSYHKAIYQGKVQFDPKTPAYGYIRGKYSVAEDVKRVDSATAMFGACLHNQQDFLFWHRAYLFHFEKIAQLLLRDDSFAIPYWYWDSHEKFEEPRLFLNPLANCEDNPLCSASRDFQASKIRPWELRDLVLSALDAKHFLASESDDGFGQPIKQQGSRTVVTSEPSKINIEHGAHDRVHNSSGGWLKSPLSSAFDPLFWVHHSNVDRIFSKWLSSENKEWCPESQAWDSKEWLNTSVAPFYSKNGGLTTMTRRDLLDVGTAGYCYDDPSFGNRLSDSLSKYLLAPDIWPGHSPQSNQNSQLTGGQEYQMLLSGAGGRVITPTIGIFPIRQVLNASALGAFADHVAVHRARTHDSPALLILVGLRVSGLYEYIRVSIDETTSPGGVGIDLGEVGFFQFPFGADAEQESTDYVISISRQQLDALRRIQSPAIHLVSKSRGDTSSSMLSLGFEMAFVLVIQEPS